MEHDSWPSMLPQNAIMIDRIQKVLMKLVSKAPDASPKIICFYTRSRVPASCEPMREIPNL